MKAVRECGRSNAADDRLACGICGRDEHPLESIESCASSRMAAWNDQRSMGVTIPDVSSMGPAFMGPIASACAAKRAVPSRPPVLGTPAIADRVARPNSSTW